MFLLENKLFCPDGDEAMQHFREALQAIEESTREQASCDLWKAVRKVRITASNFGQVAKATERRDLPKLVYSLMHPRKLDDVGAVRWGREHEPIAIKKFEEQSGLSVRAAGIFIDPRWPYLGASPDGVIDNYTIIEVKCPYASRSRPINEITVPYLQRDDQGALKLKTSHSYYYQVQGQLLLSGRLRCLFIVYTGYTEEELIVVDIAADAEFQMNMIDKLRNFFNSSFCPALIAEKVYKNTDKLY